MVTLEKVQCELVEPVKQILLSIRPTTSLDTLSWIEANRLMLEQYLVKFGGILLRGFGINSISEFNKIVQIFDNNLLDYVYRSTPRTKLGGKIFTATEYPAKKEIPLHNENSYSQNWPSKIFFFSIIVAEEQGNTPIADSRRVYKNIDQSIKDAFESKGVLYVRNYHSNIDLSWQEVFQTHDKSSVNRFCESNKIEYEWKTTGTHELTTKQLCQASIQHPVSKEYVWFNQAHLFHESALDLKDKHALLQEVGENNLPRNAFYGDGSSIELAVLENIRDAYAKEKITFQWERGDIMLLDNILTCHGREAYKGSRKVAVAMS